MIKRLTIVLVMWLALSVLALPVSGGSLQDVPLGGTVFIGEENLNLTGIPSGTILSWYTGTRIIGQSAPTATINVGNNASFYVAPSDFAGRTGNWFIGCSTQVGFIVNDPVQTVSVYDQEFMNDHTEPNDVTDKKVPVGDYLTFRIETNMNVIPAQRPSDIGFFSIRVRSPDGTVYTRLSQDATTTINLEDLSPDAMPWYWVPLADRSEEGWSTGLQGPENTSVYPAGRYTFWTESDLNGIKDNYKEASGSDFTGRTVSAVHTVTIESDKVRIVVNNKSVTRGKTFTVTINGNPGNTYYLWVKGTKSMSGKAGAQPPSIISSQEGVRMDPKAGPWSIGQYVFKGSTQTIQQDVAQYYGRDNVHGVVYYAAVTMSGNGTRTVGFSTTKDTHDQKYTIRVERPDPYDPPASDTGTNRTFKTGEVGIGVEKGGVEVDDQPSVLRCARTYYLGEEITLTGDNSETEFTYLFITGPNLPKNGGQMTNPGKPVNPDEEDTFARAEVDDDGTWEYNWETAGLNLDTGAYTIYAVPEKCNKSTLAEVDYNTVSVIIRKPFISARVSPSVVAAGDTLSIRGIAAGQPENSIAVWVLGTNKVIYQTPSVNTDGTFEQEISKARTGDMAAGQYFVVVQHPMYNQIFDIWPVSSVAGFNNNDLVAGSYPVQGNTLFRLQGEGSLQGPDAAEALVQALDNPAIDDIYAKLQFLVEVPAITLFPVTEKMAGDTFSISGTTNLAINDTILVEVTSSSFKPTMKTENGEFSGASGTVTVRKGTDGHNLWSFPVNASTFKPDEYLVQATGLTVNAQASGHFNVVEFNQATHRAIPPDEEIQEGPDTGITDTVTANTSTDDEGDSDSSGFVSINTKASKLARVIESRTTPVPTSVTTNVEEVNVTGTDTVVPADTALPTVRPTVQPGFGALIALIGLGVVVFRLGRRH